MDIDNSGPPAQDAAAEALQAELDKVLERIERNPNNLRALRRHVDLLVQLGKLDEATDAINSVSLTMFLGEGLWIRFLDAKLGALAAVDLDVFADILELFGKAEAEYLSPPIVKRHMQFVIRLSAYPAEDGAYAGLKGDEEVVEYLDTPTVRSMLSTLVASAAGIIDQTQDLWQLWMDWELRLLVASKGSAKKEQTARVHEMYLERLSAPQPTLDATSSAYSTWISETSPEEYETRMVQVTEASQAAKAKWTERRFGQARGDFEEQLMYAADAGAQLAILTSYLDWEMNLPKPKPQKGKKGKKAAVQQQEVDRTLVRAVFERIALAYGRVVGQAEDASFIEEATLKRGQKSQMLQMAYEYMAAEAGVWVRYVDFVIGCARKDAEAGEDVVRVSERSVRACPTSGELWARQLNVLEQGNEVPAIETAVDRAKGLILGNKRPVADLVEVLCAHTAILLRRFRSLEASLEHPLFNHIVEALKTVTDNYEEGDPTLRLEKLAFAWADAVPEILIGVLTILDEPVKSRVSSYQMALLRTNAHLRLADVDAARAEYQRAATQWDMDWPEPIYEAFLLFENVHGSLDEVFAAREVVAKQQAKVNRRRAQEAVTQQAAAAEEYRLAVEAQAAAAPAAPVAAAASSAMDVDVTEASVSEPTAAAATTTAATSAPAPAPVPTPAAETKPETHLKRDRENTTVLVTGLNKGISQERVTAFFDNWGKLREVTMLPAEGEATTDAAMVEYVSSDSLPAVLEKDRRKLDGAEVHVAMLWRSTLFVTNFAASADDAALRKLFSQYGTILQTRWPSRKYADSRRFCYITMETPAAAQEAQEMLHNFKMDGGQFAMTVLVSDPSAKKQRSDEANSVLFVGGLTPKTTEANVRQLFSPHGTIIGIKLGWDNVKRICKGFAFVEMATQDEAKAAAAATNGTQYHGRGLKVELSDPNHGNKKRHGLPKPAADEAASSAGAASSAATASGHARHVAAAERRAVQVVLHDLPQGTQEGLLQQELEKVTHVARVEVFADTREAVVELQSQQDVGKFLIRHAAGFPFNGAVLPVGDRTTEPTHKATPAASASTAGSASASKPAGGAAAPAAASASKPAGGAAAPAAAAAPTSSLGFAPRAARKPKAVGKTYVPPKKAAATAAQAPVPAGSGQDAFRAFMTATNEKRKDKLEEKVAASASAAKEAPASDAKKEAAPEVKKGEKHALSEEETEESAKRARVE